MRRRAVAALVATTALLTAAGTGGAVVWSASAADDRAGARSIPVRIERDGDDVTVLVPMRINGRGPFQLVLDTGASSTALNPRVLRRIEADATGERVQATDASGSVSSARTYWIDSWKAGGVALERDAVVSALDADFDEDGLLGADQLSRFRSVTIDWSRRLLVLTPKAPR